MLHRCMLALALLLPSQSAFAAVSYKWDVSLETLDFLLHREDFTINDQETLASAFTLKYDDEKHFQLLLKPRVRIDFLDPERNRYLPNESFFKIYGDQTEFAAGLQLRSWGVSNSFNPTDMINRKDYGDNFFIPEKLGDVIVSLKHTLPKVGAFEDVSMEFLALPWFLETPMPSVDSRFAVAGTVSGLSFTRYDVQDDPDLLESLGAGLRVAGSIKGWDTELLFYHGPEKQPTFFMLIDPSLNLRAVPFYYLVDMVGTNISKSAGAFVLHLESAFKITELNAVKNHAVPFTTTDVIPNNYWQFVPGIDFTQDGVFGGGTLVWTLEYLGEDDVGVIFEEFRPFKSDVFFGFRYEFNNTRLMRFQAGVMKDVLNQEMVIQTQFHTNLVKGLGLDFESVVLNQDSDANAPMSLFANNSYLGLNLNYSLCGN